MKRAVITGATGAIGTALVRELISHDIEVLVCCREGSARNEQIPEHALVARTFCALDQLAGLENVSGKPYDVFYHFAWEGTTGQARDDMYLQNQNVRHALDAVLAAKRLGCHTFIGAGSQAEYGRVEGMLGPDTPVHPEMGYGIGKLAAGFMTRELAHQQGMKHIWTRILSVYGPNDGAGSMVMTTVRTLKRGEVPKLTKGEQMWDYLYSKDAGRAFFLLGEKGKDGKVYVIGNGTARPLKEYVEDIRDVTAPGAALDLGAVPYGDRQVMYLCADVSSLREDTGWEPETAFRDGIREIVRREL